MARVKDAAWLVGVVAVCGVLALTMHHAPVSPPSSSAPVATQSPLLAHDFNLDGVRLGMPLKQVVVKWGIPSTQQQAAGVTISLFEQTGSVISRVVASDAQGQVCAFTGDQLNHGTVRVLDRTMTLSMLQSHWGPPSRVLHSGVAVIYEYPSNRVVMTFQHLGGLLSYCTVEDKAAKISYPVPVPATPQPHSEGSSDGHGHTYVK